MAVTRRRLGTAARAVAALIAAGVAVAGDPAAAQSAGELMPEETLPSWMTAWTPFTIGADLPRTPGSAVLPPDLLRPPPRIGLFWTRGNPGALPLELDDGRTEFSATIRDLSGDYRRPGDAERASVPGLSALGWTRMSDRGAAIGRVVSEQRNAAGSPAVSKRAYGSSPFTAIDTAGADVRDTRSRLEGAGGWRVGRVAFGVAAGFEAHDHRTRASGLPRFGRSAAPAVSTGLVAGLGPLRIGPYARWSSFAETTQAVSVTRTGLVHGIDGFREPAGQLISSSFPYFLRIEHDVRAAGLGAAGDWNGLAWTAFVEADRLRQTRWNDRSEDRPPKDRWSADAASAGFAAQRSLAGVLWTLDARWTTLTGHGRLAGAEDIEFEADESAIAGALDARLEPGDHPWSAALRLSLAYETRDRVDDVAGLATTIESLAPGAAAAVGFAPRDGTLITAGLGHSRYLTRGAIPALRDEGPAFHRSLAPELALIASPATAWSMSLAAGHRLSSGISLWARAERASVAPGASFRTLQFRPDGHRAVVHAAAGVTLTGR